MKSRAAKKSPATNKPVLTPDGIPLARIRRAPNPWAFLITGAVVGMILGFVLSSLGDNGSYEGSSASAYFLVLFGALGMLLGGLVFVVADRRS